MGSGNSRYADTDLRSNRGSNSVRPKVVLLNKKPANRNKKPLTNCPTIITAVESLPQLLDQDQVKAIVTDHFEGAIKLAWSFLNRWRIKIAEDEVQSVAGAALCEAATRFNPTLGVSFKTFFFYHLRGMLLKDISSRVEERGVLQSFDESLENSYDKWDSNQRIGVVTSIASSDLNPEEELARIEVNQLTRKVCNDLDELERTILFRSFVNEQSVVEIAKELGYCRCHISRVKNRLLETLAKRLKSVFGDDYESLGMSKSKTANDKYYRGGRGRRKSEINQALKSSAAL
jgi:RNA polymerase sigma factor (sigma-70 family)